MQKNSADKKIAHGHFLVVSLFSDMLCGILASEGSRGTISYCTVVVWGWAKKGFQFQVVKIL